MAPVRLGDGTNIESIRLGDGTEIAEVRTGAGDVVFAGIKPIPTANLVHNYDALQLSFAENDSVSTWTDSFGSADIPSQNGDPIYGEAEINGLPGIKFDGTGGGAYYGTRGTNLGTGNASFTVFALARNDGSTSSGGHNNGLYSYGVHDSSSPGSSIAAMTFEQNNQGNFRWYGNNTEWNSGYDTGAHLWVTRYDGSLIELYEDGTRFSGSGDSHSGDFDQGAAIGREWGNEATAGDYDVVFNGAVGQVAFYNTDLSDAGVNEVANVIADNWGLTWSDI